MGATHIEPYIFLWLTGILLLQLPLPEGVLPRCDHSTVAVDLAPGLTEVTVFAGCQQFDPKKTIADDVKLTETIILTFGMLPATTNLSTCLHDCVSYSTLPLPPLFLELIINP